MFIKVCSFVCLLLNTEITVQNTFYQNTKKQSKFLEFEDVKMKKQLNLVYSMICNNYNNRAYTY